MSAPPAVTLARLDDSLLLVVDVQERLFPHIDEHAVLGQRIATLASGMDLLGVPVIATEQYVKGLGKTVPAVASAIPQGAPVLEKTAFSCAREPAIMGAIRATGRRTVFLAGIEAHICVLQTALDLLREGYAVHVVADAVGSRVPLNKDAGLARAAQAGAVVSTLEMALFELMGGKEHPRFKDVQALVK